MRDMDVLTPEEAAVELRLLTRSGEPNVRQLYRLPIPRIRLGPRTFRYHRVDLARFLERKKLAAA